MVKRVAAMNDISGLGHCSLSALMAVLPAMGIQCCPLPTCVLSSQTDGYEGFSFCDLTPNLSDYLRHWETLGEKFDGIFTGYLGNPSQLSYAQILLKKFKKENGIALVDPVMGDDGALYSGMPETMCESMRALLSCADVITPNLTEACLLTGREFRDYSVCELAGIARELSALGPERVLISGIFNENTVSMLCLDKGEASYIERPKINASYPGSGDVFAGVLLGKILKGADLKKAAEESADFVSLCLEGCIKESAPRREGLVFEPFLSALQ